MPKNQTAVRRGEGGFSYLMLMIATVIIGVAMSVAARQWKVLVQRELESDLLAKGIEIQNALILYSASAKGGRVMPGEVYPQTLAELTRQPKPFLRKVYLDPVGHGEWELVRAPTGGVMGVRSRSMGKPVKQHGFPLAVRHFEGKSTHHDWVFQHPNPSTPGVGASPGTQPLLGTSELPAGPGGAGSPPDSSPSPGPSSPAAAPGPTP